MLLCIQVAHLKEELAGKNKENEILRNMISSLRVYEAGPTALSKRSPIIPQLKNTKIMQVEFCLYFCNKYSIFILVCTERNACFNEGMELDFVYK